MTSGWKSRYANTGWGSGHADTGWNSWQPNAGWNSWCHADGGRAGGWTARQREADQTRQRQDTDAWSTWRNNRENTGSGHDDTPFDPGFRGSLECSPSRNSRHHCRSNQVANFLRRCLKVMWDAAIEHRKQHNNFDVSAFCGHEINWETYKSEHAAKHIKAPSISFTEFQQVQRTCVESYLAKRKFHVRLSTRYLYKYGLANMLLRQGDLQYTSADSGHDSDSNDSSSADSDLADLAKHAADVVANPPSTVPGDLADKSAATSGSSTGAAASAHSAATAGSSTGAAASAHSAATAGSSTSPAQPPPVLSPTSSSELPLT